MDKREADVVAHEEELRQQLLAELGNITAPLDVEQQQNIAQAFRDSIDRLRQGGKKGKRRAADRRQEGT
jgi:hypothetical protein